MTRPRQKFIQIDEEITPRKKRNNRFKIGLISALIVTLGTLGTVFATGGGNEGKIGTESQMQSTSDEMVKSEEVEVIETPSAEKTATPTDAVHTQQPTQQEQPQVKVVTVEIPKTVIVEKIVEVPKVVVTQPVQPKAPAPKKESPTTPKTKPVTPPKTEPKKEEKPSTTPPKTEPKEEPKKEETKPSTTPPKEQTPPKEETKPTPEKGVEKLTLLTQTDIFDSIGGAKVGHLAPQTVFIIAQSGEWFQVKSFLGAVWLKPNTHFQGEYKLTLASETVLYKEYQKDATNIKVGPGTFTVVFSADNWYQIKSVHGTYWVNVPNASVSK